MDPFHVVGHAGNALDRCRQRVQQSTLGHRGHSGDPHYTSRGTLHTADDLLTDNQRTRFSTLFDSDGQIEVEATRGIYQRIIAAYRNPDRKSGLSMMEAMTASTSHGVPKLFTEIQRLGRTLKQRAANILGFFDRPGSSNGPTEAINGPLEHLRGTGLGLRILTHYIARSLLEAGGFRPKIHS